MRVRKMIPLMLMGWPLLASACSCLETPAQYFLNTVARSPGSTYVNIPENAKGVLFYSDVYLRDVEDIDAGKLQVESVPSAVSAAQFSIVDRETGRSFQPIVTRLNVDRQIGHGEKQRVYSRRNLGILNVLQDVTAEVKKANGLFRVGPSGGFRSGHRYLFTYRPHGIGQKLLQTEVRIGPPITLPFAGNYGLRLEGQFTSKMISLPEQAKCGEKTAAIVQELTYTVPPSLAPYSNGVLFFTQQRARLDRDGKEPVFTNSRYKSYLCARPPPGHGELGDLKDLAVAPCNRYGEKWEDTLVKGYVGMLEIEDTLHETATYTIPLGKSARALCAVLGTSNEG